MSLRGRRKTQECVVSVTPSGGHVSKSQRQQLSRLQRARDRLTSSQCITGRWWCWGVLCKRRRGHRSQMAGIRVMSRKGDGQREQSFAVHVRVPMRSHVCTYTRMWLQPMLSHVCIHVSTTLAKIEKSSLLEPHLCPPLPKRIPPSALLPDNHSPVPHFYNVISRMLYKWDHKACNLLGLTFSTRHNCLESRL